MGSKCAAEQCQHGMCLNHGPQWETIEDPAFDPSPTLFLRRRTYWLMRCCGKAMQRVTKGIRQRCRKCGRRRFEVREYDLARCACCGRYEAVESHEENDG